MQTAQLDTARPGRFTHSRHNVRMEPKPPSKPVAVADDTMAGDRQKITFYMTGDGVTIFKHLEKMLPLPQGAIIELGLRAIAEFSGISLDGLDLETTDTVASVRIADLLRDAQNTPKDLVGYPQAAEMLGLKVESVRKRVEVGTLKTYNLPGSATPYFSLAELEQAKLEGRNRRGRPRTKTTEMEPAK